MDVGRRIPILCYHRVHADEDPHMPAIVPGEYCGHVTLSAFERQIVMLAERGFSTVTHREIMDWLAGTGNLPDGPVAAMDFDDNRQNVLENSFPVMQEHGFRGTMFVVAALAEGHLPHMQKYPALKWEQLAVLRDAGWTLGAHTLTHAFLGSLYTQPNGPERVEEELVKCRELIEDRLGTRVPNFAYPGGDWSVGVEEMVKRQFRTARHWSCELPAQYNTRETDPYRLQAINISALTCDKDFEAILAGAASSP